MSTGRDRFFRRPDWRRRLIGYMARVQRAPFRPGRHDCMLFAAGAVRAMTGRDPARGWRGRYRSLAEGQALLEAAGHADHVALIASLLDEWPAPVSAMVGDVAVVAGSDALPAVGIVQGPSIWVIHPGDGAGLVPLTAARRAFHVPFRAVSPARHG